MLRSENVAFRRRLAVLGGAWRFSAALGGTIVEGGPTNLLIIKKTTFGIRAFEPGGREFESLRARH